MAPTPRLALLGVLAALLALATSPAASAAPLRGAAKACTIMWKKPMPTGAKMTIAKGTKCSFVWADGLEHCVNFKRPNALNLQASKHMTGKNKKYEVTFSQKGTYFARCCTHLSNMKLTITVV